MIIDLLRRKSLLQENVHTEGWKLIYVPYRAVDVKRLEIKHMSHRSSNDTKLSTETFHQWTCKDYDH